MWRLLIIGSAILGVTLFGFSLIDVRDNGEIGADALVIAPEVDLTGYTRALEPLDWQFPQNFGAHEDYLTEWWYYTGNLQTEDGRRFGYQFTIFRRAITPTLDEASASPWRTNQMYMAHFTISDIDGGRFLHDERYSRGAVDLAGATVEPRYRVWLEDWQVVALDDEARHVRIDAHSEDFGLVLELEQIKPPALQGDGGLSPKSAEIGNASHYYTLSRLPSVGVVSIGDERFDVTGISWKDHEFSTSALGEDAQGWDWFSLIFDDNTEMMVGQIRLAEGGREPAFGGLFIFEDGTTRYLPSHTFTIEATETWTSPHTGAVYPSGWVIHVEDEVVQLRLEVTPLMRDQELYSADIAYWEGAISIAGDKTGVGYAELTGYVDTMQGRF